ncbi:MAG: prepilin-type N-terminal cleavage/methylation domain-containing protein [Planctomycetota bacterium]|jgi:prepilin-type N-terminal cleavage/methylation domain-containing protein|nr:prepilin-type N-terminal cleavage/methylation domain-containing protein [Planctomycetota bacterium]
MRTQGFTLLEIMIGSAILSVVLLTTVQTMKMSADISTDTVSRTNLAADAGRILHLIAMDLRAADKDFIYNTDDATVNIFSYKTCTGFSSNGAPVYGTEGNVTITFDKVEGTLVRTTNEAETILSEQVLPYDLIEKVEGFELIKDLNSSLNHTVYGNRIQLNLTLVANYGEDSEMRHTASRVIFLRSWLFNTDGLNASLGNANPGGGSTTLPPADQTAEEYPADYPDEPIPADILTPVDNKGAPNGAPALTWQNLSPQLSDEDIASGKDPSLLVKITINTSAQGSTIVGDSITVNFPHHYNEAFEIKKTDNGNGTFTLTISGPRVGNTPITVGAKSIDKKGNPLGEALATNSF